MVGQAKPSLLEILHAKAVSPLCSLDHEPEKKDNAMNESDNASFRKHAGAGTDHSTGTSRAFCSPTAAHVTNIQHLNL